MTCEHILLALPADPMWATILTAVIGIVAAVIKAFYKPSSLETHVPKKVEFRLMLKKYISDTNIDRLNIIRFSNGGSAPSLERKMYISSLHEAHSPAVHPIQISLQDLIVGTETSVILKNLLTSEEKINGCEMAVLSPKDIKGLSIFKDVAELDDINSSLWILIKKRSRYWLILVLESKDTSLLEESFSRIALRQLLVKIKNYFK